MEGLTFQWIVWTFRKSFFKPGVCQNINLSASSTAKNVPLVNPAFLLLLLLFCFVLLIACVLPGSVSPWAHHHVVGTSRCFYLYFLLTTRKGTESAQTAMARNAYIFFKYTFIDNSNSVHTHAHAHTHTHTHTHTVARAADNYVRNYNVVTTVKLSPDRR